MKILNFELDRTFWIEYSIAGVISSFLAFIVYAKEHTKYTFDLFQFITWLPVVWILLLIIALGFGIFLSWGKKEN